jgi:Tol biopolymer transport system component
MDIKGDNITTVYDGGAGVSTGAFPPGNYDPSWSPDDQWIVFERAVKSGRENWGSGIWHIFKVRRNGSDVEDISLAGGHADRSEYLPSYSPDGKFIVFGTIYEAKNPRDSLNDVFIMDTNGKGLKRLTLDLASDKDMYPVWIPSGR